MVIAIGQVVTLAKKEKKKKKKTGKGKGKRKWGAVVFCPTERTGKFEKMQDVRSRGRRERRPSKYKEKVA